MRPERDGIELRQGDCVEIMRSLEAASVDAIVTDPPYGLGFMGKEWDTPGSFVERKAATRNRFDHVGGNHNPTCSADSARTRCAEGRKFQEHMTEWASEALRVAKPGAHLVAFGGTRTFHRLTCAIEDAGWEIRDSIGWHHMEHVFCQCQPGRMDRDVGGAKVSAQESRAGNDLPDVRENVSSRAVTKEAECSELLLGVLSEQDVRSPASEDSESRQGGVDGGEPVQLPRQDERRAQPRVERRRDVQAPQGELQAGTDGALSCGSAPDGAEQRVHAGASDRNGALDRVAAAQDGGGASSQPRPARQQPREPGAVAVEWIPQGGGAWPGCLRCGKPLAPPLFQGPLAWNYATGFPKSLDVSKAIDKAAGAEREVVGVKKSGGASALTGNNADAGPTADAWREAGGFAPGLAPITAPATDAAREWSGWGTALKPAWEPIILARKPLEGTVAANVQKHGCGALNIDGCRIETTDDLNGGAYSAERQASESPWAHKGSTIHNSTGRAFVPPSGRWPANLVLDKAAAEALDEQSGERSTSKPGSVVRRRAPEAYESASIGAESRPAGSVMVAYGDTGGASRFFYCAKAGKRDRGEGNSHPTVKPHDLMCWLVRLVTPPGGLVLDPFTGSGSTGLACQREGFRFLGIEREAEYLEIAAKRLSQLSLFTEAAQAAATMH